MYNLNYSSKRQSVSSSFKRIYTTVFASMLMLLMFNANSFGQCPTPTITPSGSTDLCAGGSVTLTASLGVSYVWSTGATTQAIVVGSAGNFWVTVDDGAGCVETSDTLTTTLFAVAPGKIIKIEGEPRACPGDLIVYAVKQKPRTAKYVWTLSGGLTINGLTTYSSPDTAVQILFDNTFTGSGVIEVFAQNGCGVGPTKTLNVGTGKPNPPSTISGPVSGLCGTVQTYTVNPILGATFTWTPPTGSFIISGQGTNTAQILFSGSLNNGFVKVYYTNICGTSKEEKLAVSGEPIITGQPSNLNACDSSQATFTVTAAGTPIYQWRKNGVNLVNGGTISGANSATLVIDPVVAGDAGNYTCVLSNSCSGSVISNAASLTVSAAPGMPGTISGIKQACPGTTGEVYSIAAVPNATFYEWIAYQGATITSGQGTNSITVDFNPTNYSGYYIVVRAGASCGLSDSVKTWVRYSVSVPTFNTTQNTVCPGQTGIVYAVDTVVGATGYNWSVPAGATIVSGIGTESITVNFSGSFTSGQVCVSASNACVTTLDRCENVNSIPNDAGNINGQFTNVCSSTQVYTTNPVSGGATNYIWNVPVGASIVSGQGTTSITVDFGPSFSSGDICVEANNGCGSGAQKCKTAVGFPGKPAIINGNAAPCASATGEVYSIAAIPGATSYVWSVPPGATIASGQGTTSITVDFGTTDGIISVYGVNSCGNGYSKNLRVIFGCRKTNPGIISPPSALVAMPNPFTDKLKLMLTYRPSGPFIIKIVDQFGRAWITKNVPFNNDNTIHLFNTTGLASGMYIIQVIDGTTVQTLSVIKQ